MKTIGFIMFSLQKVKRKTIGFIDRVAEKQWKNIGFTVNEPRATEKHWKTIGFTVKRAPGNRKTNPGQPGNGNGVWDTPTRLDTLWGTLTDKLFRE